MLEATATDASHDLVLDGGVRSRCMALSEADAERICRNAAVCFKDKNVAFRTYAVFNEDWIAIEHCHFNIAIAVDDNKPLKWRKLLADAAVSYIYEMHNGNEKDMFSLEQALVELDLRGI